MEEEERDLLGLRGGCGRKGLEELRRDREGRELKRVMGKGKMSWRECDTATEEEEEEQWFWGSM